ncbi:lanthionine synthetase LanC family protein [Streptomyces chartreusis]|uniref:lanthionine synthetase LanC family protein n=1 Tax=Streptomyces chartreusis TaxID=1969 RepID=UPI0036A7395F
MTQNPWPTDHRPTKHRQKSRDGSLPPERMTHWCSGSSGIGTFLLRLWAATGDPDYRSLAHAAAASVRAHRWFAPPAACCGLAGDGSFLLDLAEITGENRYHICAQELAAWIFAQNVHRDGRILYQTKPASRSRRATTTARPASWHSYTASGTAAPAYGRRPFYLSTTENPLLSRMIVTHKLRSYSAAPQEGMPSATHLYGLLRHHRLTSAAPQSANCPHSAIPLHGRSSVMPPTPSPGREGARTADGMHCGWNVVRRGARGTKDVPDLRRTRTTAMAVPRRGGAGQKVFAAPELSAALNRRAALDTPGHVDVLRTRLPTHQVTRVKP